MEPSKTSGAEIDPTEFPRVILGSETYEVKFRCGDVIRLKKECQIDVFTMFTKPEDGGPPKITGIDGMERTFLLLSYGLSHEKSFKPDELADLVGFERMAEMSIAVMQALGKAFAQAAKLAQAAGMIPAPAVVQPKTDPVIQ